MKTYDVVIIGGGPAGLSAALTFGRGRASALLVDGGTPRNARAHEIHNFVTRDGTPPAQFRELARAQLAAYASVEVRSGLATRIEPLTTAEAEEEGLAFRIHFEGDAPSVETRRVLLATGMRDELPSIPGIAELWGATIFQCPYCHGWELRDRAWGVLVTSEQMAAFAPMLTAWASRLTVFTNGTSLAETTTRALVSAGITVESEPVARLRGTSELEGVELASGKLVPCAALVVRPPQSPVDLVVQLGLERDENGFVRVDPMKKESSIPGIHVVGDTTTMQQAAIIAAADGMSAAAVMNHALVFDRLARGAARSGAAPR